MDALHTALEKLVRGDGDTIHSYFHELKTDCLVEGTSAACHFHCVNLDGNGRPKVDALVQYLVSNVIDYAIPRKKINEAIKYQQETGSTTKVVKLLTQAMGLFTRLANSGEGGELILFLFAEKFLRLPQIICKMNLKTSSQMHYHGADGVHIGVDKETQKLCLYWGESKLYSDLTQAIYQCMKSITPLMMGNMGGGSAEERDIQLLSDFMNVDDPDLEYSLKRFLDPDEPDFNKLEYRGICLVGFDIDDYPINPRSIDINGLAETFNEKIDAWKTSVKRRILKENIHGFSLHVFLIPFPSVEVFRKNLLSSFGGE
ncbi:HamA C-terminal domain-containing protein [Serratia proteamaculans]